MCVCVCVCVCVLCVFRLHTLSSQAHVSGVLESCSTLHSSLDSLASSGVSQSATQWTQDTATLSSAISEFTNSQETAIAAAEKSVSHYIAEELAVDVPTGICPSIHIIYSTCTWPIYILWTVHSLPFCRQDSTTS